MKTVYDRCEPRADVLNNRLKESDFAADLALVLRGNAPKEYADPAGPGPGTDPSFIDDARQKFCASSAYLDDRPGALLSTTYVLAFGAGLSLEGDHADKLTERLTRFATGAAFVEAYAEAAK